MKKILFLFGSILICGSAFAQSSVTLTTYYPAPYGAYDQLRLVPRATPTDPCNPGALYVDSADGKLKYCETTASGWGNIAGVWDESGDNLFPAETATNPNIQVGIGTTTPDSTLTIETTGSNATIHLERTDGADFSISSTDSATTLGTTGTAPLQIQTDNTERITILNTGEVGIGTTSPTSGQALTINGNIDMDIAADDDVVLRFMKDGQAYTMGIDSNDSDKFKINGADNFGTAGEEMFSIDNSGNVLIRGTLTIMNESNDEGEIKLQYVDDSDDSNDGYYATYAP